MPTLYLRCKTCNIEFASGISVDEKSFETMVLSRNQHRCPENHTNTYDKKDYYLGAKGSKMRYKNFSVTNFRIFKDISLSNFKRINLIAGRNNTGKTSLLESIYLHGGSLNPEVTLKVEGFRGIRDFTGRGGIQSDERITPWDNLFHNFDNNNIMEMISSDYYDKIEKTRIYIEKDSTQIITYPDIEKDPMQINDYPDPTLKIGDGISLIPGSLAHTITIENESSGKILTSSLRLDEKGMTKTPPFTVLPFQLVFHATRLRFSTKIDTDRFSRLQIEGNKDLAIQTIKIIDDEIENMVISTIGRTPSLYIYDGGLGSYIPLLSSGEGMVKIIQILFEIQESRNGIYLIDEIENGFHHSILPKVWDMIYRLSELFNVQVFATTHSIEVIKAAHKVFSEKEVYAFKLYRLEKINDEINAIPYEKEELEAAIELELEVR